MFISSPSCRGNVPDIGVMMGDEMLIPFMLFFFLGDMIDEKIEEALDSVFSGSCRSRSKFAGLFLLFFRMLCFGWTGVGSSLETGEMAEGGLSNVIPACFAASCSITYLYISSSCCCAISRSAATTL